MCVKDKLFLIENWFQLVLLGDQNLTQHPLQGLYNKKVHSTPTI